MGTEWHFTTWIDLLDHWQAVIAGATGFAAAIIAVVLTLGSERRKAARELDSLRKSLGVEIRQFTLQALNGHRSLRKLAQLRGQPITTRMIENYVHVPMAVIYPSSADKIGLLGSEAMSVVAIYMQIEIVRDAIRKLMNHRSPDNIQPAVVAAVASGFMMTCKTAAKLLPKMRTETEEFDRKDDELIEQITNEEVLWLAAKQEWLEVT